MGFAKHFLVIFICSLTIRKTLGTPQGYGNNWVSVPATGQLWSGNGANRPLSQDITPPSYYSTPNRRKCRSQEVGKGRYKVICGESGPIVSSEHILWLQQSPSVNQVIDIQVPNYAIRELIKAGFKPTSSGDTTINILLKRPNTYVDAQVGHNPTAVQTPRVNIQYERPHSKIIHFPNDQRYSPLRGPIIPPLASQQDQIDIRYG